MNQTLVKRSAQEQKPKPKFVSTGKVAKAYDSPPWWYDIRGFFILTFAYQSTLWSQIRFFARFISGRHLEVAVGTGTLLGLTLSFCRWMSRPFSKLVAMDYSETMLSGAIKRFASNPDVELYPGDVANLPEADESFDSVSIANSFHSFSDPKGALREIHRVLKLHGTLAMNVLLYPRGIWPMRSIASAINRWGIRKGILVTPYTQDDVRRLVTEAGFRLTEERASGNCLFVVAEKSAGRSQ